jgi:chromosome segregation ATPase
MSQQPADVNAYHALDAGNKEDLSWVLDKTTFLIVHHTCFVCNCHLDHYRETGMRPNSVSFQRARQEYRNEIRQPLLLTYNGLKVLCQEWNTMTKGLEKEIKAAEKELEAIKQETDKSSWELEKLLQESKEVREEAANFRSEEARPMDEDSGLTNHSRSPRRRMDVDHTRTPHAQSVKMNNPDSDSEIESISSVQFHGR